MSDLLEELTVILMWWLQKLKRGFRRAAQKFDMDRFNLKKAKLCGSQQYQVRI
jgi:hypothetical protein